MKQWFSTLTKKQLLALVAGICIAAIAMYVVLRDKTNTIEAELAPLPAVTVSNATTLASGNSISLVGSVRAFSEAAVTAERGGRITSVRTSLGNTVGAGQVLVTLENAAESAAVLQAEGAYDAAVAAAARSGISLNDAENNYQTTLASAVNLVRSSYVSAESAIKTNVDIFVGNADSQNPWLKIDGDSRAGELLDARIGIGAVLTSWHLRANSLTTTADVELELQQTSVDIGKVIVVLDKFISVLSQQKDSASYQASVAGLVAKRAELLGLQSNITTVLGGIKSARDGVAQAKLGASGGVTSAADAQVKQALGALRAAQANYAKTVLRAPVSGTVNELPVRVGDFIGPQTKVALVANNNALEIVTYASDAELFALQPGDTVTIEGQYEGIITTIAPAVDSATGKTEVRIASENADIKNGDTVRITAAVSVEDVADGTIRVPLTAVKFERADGFMFRVNNSVLEKFPVTLGPVFGGEVVIASGLTATDEFVVDARGLREGDSVEVTK